ncbi:MAG: IucA/IucC family siderophore biosynthesis protein [Proteobacteria bacterium]|nr:MAG: IucA/IucC family siderophore biosynthesis protein [Pseudomonadota bacterium]
MAKIFEIEAQRASMTCFLNSLLREWGLWDHVELPELLKRPGQITSGIRIDVLGGEKLWIPLEHWSSLGRHEYGWPVYLEAESSTYEILDFHALSQLLIDTIEVKEGNVAQSKQRFKARVEDSLIAVQEVLSHRSQDLSELSLQSMSFLDAEQYLVVGHSFHPSPKSREGFTAEDRQRYCPEYAGKFPLAWFAVDPYIVRRVSSEAFAGKNWVQELIEADPLLSSLVDAKIPEGFLLYPMHPWQALHLLAMPKMKAHQSEGRILSLGEHGGSWYPTSSVRSIYQPKSPYMLKTSLSVRLTNSVRTLLLREVDRGVQAHDVFCSSEGKKLLALYPDFKVIYEPAYWAILDDEANPIDESIVICRMNPFEADESGQGLVLASLTQDDPFYGETVIETLIESYRQDHAVSGRVASELWFDRYCRVVLEPLLMAQADFGILLGAHQQNILVAMEDSLPKTLYFRDCQGTGYSELAYENLKDEIASLDLTNGNVLPKDMANTLFIYYLFINATFNVISTIARKGHLSEDAMIESLRNILLEMLSRKPRDPSCIMQLLMNEKILHKGNFICSIQDINENTTQNPLAIYTPIVNPFYQNQASEKIH